MLIQESRRATTSANCISRIAATVIALATLGSNTVDAAVLDSSAVRLPATPVGLPDGVWLNRQTTSTGYIGSWSAPVHPDWTGSFLATGGAEFANYKGTNSYDFSGLRKNYLPKGTMLAFNDLDRNNPDESLVLRAFDANGDPITAAWLKGPVGVVNNLAPVAPADMPGYRFADQTAHYVRPSGGGALIPLDKGSYFFDGQTTARGSSVVQGVFLETLFDIHTMTLVKNDTNNTFGFRAPTIPEPSTVCSALLALSAAAATGMRCRLG